MDLDGTGDSTNGSLWTCRSAFLHSLTCSTHIFVNRANVAKRPKVFSALFRPTKLIVAVPGTSHCSGHVNEIRSKVVLRQA